MAAQLSDKGKLAAVDSRAETRRTERADKLEKAFLHLVGKIRSLEVPDEFDVDDWLEAWVDRRCARVEQQFFEIYGDYSKIPWPVVEQRPFKKPRRRRLTPPTEQEKQERAAKKAAAISKMKEQLKAACAARPPFAGSKAAGIPRRAASRSRGF